MHTSYVLANTIAISLTAIIFAVIARVLLPTHF